MMRFFVRIMFILPMCFYLILVMGATTASHEWWIGILMWFGFWITFDIAKEGIDYADKNY